MEKKMIDNLIKLYDQWDLNKVITSENQLEVETIDKWLGFSIDDRKDQIELVSCGLKEGVDSSFFRHLILTQDLKKSAINYIRNRKNSLGINVQDYFELTTKNPIGKKNLIDTIKSKYVCNSDGVIITTINSEYYCKNLLAVSGVYNISQIRFLKKYNQTFDLSSFFYCVRFEDIICSFDKSIPVLILKKDSFLEKVNLNSGIWRRKK